MSVATGDVIAIFSPDPPFILRKSSSADTGDVMAIASLVSPDPLAILLPKM
jgi:hypothetical protein